MPTAEGGAIIDPVSTRRRDLDVDAQRRAGQAVADTRAVGGFFYAHLAGIRGGVPEAGTASLTIAPEPGQVGGSSTMALATLADVALGTALRSRRSPGQLLPTTDLTLTLMRPSSGQVTALARVLHLDAGGGTASCELADDAGVVGYASGTFAAQQVRPGSSLPVTPWEVGMPARQDRDPDRAPQPGELTPAEQACVQAVVSAALRAGATAAAFGDELLDLMTSQIGQGRSLGSAHVTPALANRSGTVQGGALLALAAASAAPLLPSARWELRTITYAFLRPATGTDLEAAATLRRQGRTSAVLSVDVSSQGADIGLAILRFAPPVAASRASA